MVTGTYPFTRLLIPYDGSPSAQRGLEWAGCLARGQGAKIEQITLLRVIGGGYLARHIHNVDLRVTRMDQVAAWRRMRQHHLDQEILPLLEEGKRSLQKQGVAVAIDTEVAEGKIGEEIMRVAAAGGYTAIVMGRRGLSPIKGLFLGSVTRQVLSLARKMTIWVVGPEAVFNPECPISPLLLPVDGSEASQAAVRQGGLLAQGWTTCQPQVRLLHVIEIVKVTSAVGEASGLVREGEKILADGRRILQEAGFLETAADKLRVGEPPRVIAATAEEGHYALILMGARGLSFMKELILGSVSNDVLHRTQKSVVGIVYL